MLELILLSGPPASGKTTFGKKLFNTLKKKRHIGYVSSDELRAELGENESDQSVNKEVFREMREDVLLFREYNYDVIVDCTNITRGERKNFIELWIHKQPEDLHPSRANRTITCYYFDVPREVLIQRNLDRGKTDGRFVPEHVIDRMIKKFEIPHEMEGIDKIVRISNYCKECKRDYAKEHEAKEEFQNLLIFAENGFKL